MANRVVYGNSFSSNGWPMVDQGSCTWVKIPGTSVTLQIQNGQPLAILRAFAADFHAYVEPLRDADSACWTPTNSVSTSNHLSGTAMDLNWNSHPFQVPDAGFDAAKKARVKELLDFYEGTVFWGNDWTSPKDAMHFQLASLRNGGNINTYGNPFVDDFIARKIRPDGFSTFRRGAAPAQPAAASVLAAATGLTESRATEVLPAVRDGLIQSGCTTVKRIAMWLAQVGHESASFFYTEEIAKNGRYAPYIGRTWIQITWDYNYRAFSQWCHARGLVPTADYFVVNYRELADLRWAGLGAAWYWTEQRPLNALVDAGDNATWKAGNVTYRGFEAVTAAINGGTHGLADRKARHARAIALGDQLLSLISEGGDDLTPEQDKMLREVHACLFNPIPSQSKYKADGEGARWRLHELIKNDDALLHETVVERQAMMGNPEALALVKREADKGDKWAQVVFRYCTEEDA
ncbi:lysin A [Mycobacterium phage Lucky2013]|uniref:Lysin A n=2 Tax=Omegavirus courthouse TaxID=1089119 RepID=G8I5A4_9CAUD|nr:endolysin [Mycobacterium phage Courthouse]YP_009205177.1 endolysin [Mycobacterium phage Ariel]YP_009213264.1 endolysin [Mycobacterium phage MiaZeal]ASD50684.1 lysin A [Mycobacterium phage Porcelain]ASD53440.1 lysin A [Mycobacterium phage Lucky2013]ASZ74122.1 lysin A [Mycobacterium phage Squint]ATS92890.1 lysin A [Mycobacterium phage Superphikiman]AER47898.1 lysin A [Mycobacterium phage Courthouse]